MAHCEAEAPAGSQWHLFNDFLVMPLSKSDALAFGAWKVPCVLCFQVKEASNKVDSEWKKELDTSILYKKPTLGYVGYVAWAFLVYFPLFATTLTW